MSLIFPLVTSIYVSRILRPEGIGIVSYAQTIASYFVVLASAGMPIYSIREIAKVREDQIAKNKLFTELFVFNLFLSLVASALYIALITLVDCYKNEILLYCVCGLQIFANIINIEWFYKGEEEYAYIVKRSLFVKVVSLFAIFTFINDEKDYVVYALITSCALVGNYVFNIAHVRKYVSLTFVGLNLRKHFKPVIYFALIAFLGVFYHKININMLGNMVDNFSVGIYTNAYNVIGIALMICASVTAVFLPQLSMRCCSGGPELNEIINKGYSALCFLSFPATIGIMILSKNIILTLYGDCFIRASATMFILSFLVLIKAFGDFFSYQLLVASENEKISVLVSLIVCVINVILNWVLIQKFYENGAAVAIVISELIANGVEFVYVKKHVRYKLSLVPMFQAILCSVVMMAGLYCFNAHQLHGPLCLVVSVFGGSIIYLIANMVIGNEFTYQVLGMLRRFVWR